MGHHPVHGAARTRQELTVRRTPPPPASPFLSRRQAIVPTTREKPHLWATRSGGRRGLPVGKHTRGPGAAIWSVRPGKGGRVSFRCRSRNRAQGEGPPRPRWSTPMRPPTMVGASPSGDAVSGHTGTGRSPCGALPHGDRPGRTVLSGSKALVLNRRRFPAPEHWERPDRSLSRPTGSRACVSGFFAGPGTGCRCGRSGVAGLGAGGVVVQA